MKAQFDSLRIPILEDLWLLIANNSVSEPRDSLNHHPSLPAKWSGKKIDPGSPAVLSYDPEAENRGMQNLQLLELKEYYWELEGDLAAFQIESSISNSTRKTDWREKRSLKACHGTFIFTNYLGTASITIRNLAQPHIVKVIRFDVITTKLDHETEYRSMVEAIANECQQLLLDWNAPTAIHITTDPEHRARILLEQFSFLRHVLGPDRLELFLELLHRHPHVTLQRERIWQPAATASPHLFMKDPLRFGRDWERATGGREGMVAGFNANEILDERKFESVDTPPNRFVKFALHSFRGLCEEVINAQFKDATGKQRSLREEQGAAWLEARQMRDVLDSFLSSAFFDEVGEMGRIPFESQTLQKREGYRDILQAWLMLDAAAQIDWPGREDAYDGTNRDVATLYEFWLYFILVRALKEKLGMEPLQDPFEEIEGELPFCCTKDGRLLINLKRGEASFCRFRWKNGSKELRVHLFYNRRFKQSAVSKRGTYTRGFRPDYTMVIIPATIQETNWRKAEVEAEKQGCIAYLHFDAKYRVEKLAAILGEAGDEADEEERITAKTTGTFKTADLYKMHTYNEAIRRTVGSYVLYPGSDPQNIAGENRFERYHEVLPGVGAFAVKPSLSGTDPEGLPYLISFIREILEHQVSRFTQSYRFTYYTEGTLREDRATYGRNGLEFTIEGKPPKDTQVLLGYVRDDGASLECRTKEVFFCHAVEWNGTEAGDPTDLQFDPFRSDLFVAYNRNSSSDWIATVREVKLVTAQERSDEVGRPLKEMNAAYYFRFQLADIRAAKIRNVESLVARRPSRPRACTLAEFATCAVT